MAAQREWLEKDYYRVLGVSDTASQKDIKSAYRKLSREYHPDANPGDTAAEERFKEVSAAYDVVGDAEKRKEYDEVRKLGPMGGMFGGAGGPGGPGAGGVPGDDIRDLRGVLDDNQGFFSFSSPCPQCAGRGYTIDEPCPTCRGTGVEHRPREVKVRIPAGVDDGQRIRLRGRGGPGRNGGRAGDLYVTVRVAPHELFGRKGSDLTLTMPITFPEAALGANVAVPTLDGGPVKVRIPAGTRSGRTFRVRGKGVEGRRKTGDLLVTVEVAVPQKLSADERKAIEALAAAADGRSPRAHLGAEGGP